MALARIGHRDDVDFFVDLMQDRTLDLAVWRYAALGLAYVGGDEAVRHLERASRGATPATRSAIVNALANTQSRAAVPVLIDMFNADTSYEICVAMQTLTRRNWCRGIPSRNPATARARWWRFWKQHGSQSAIYARACPSEGGSTSQPRSSESWVSTETGPPRILSIDPSFATPKMQITIEGHALGLLGGERGRVLFRQGDNEREVETVSSGAVFNTEGGETLQYTDVTVPADLTPGMWDVLVLANGRASAPVAMEIVAVSSAELVGIRPTQAHPSEPITVLVDTLVQADDEVELTDVRGQRWRLVGSVDTQSVDVQLPDDIAVGDVSVRLIRRLGSVDTFSAPRRFSVRTDPLPLSPSAVAEMKPVAPGQWTDLALDSSSEFRVARSDSVELRFTQRNTVVTTRATGRRRRHVQVPRQLRPGEALVQTRTWMEKTVSEWSEPATLTLLANPVAPTITSITGLRGAPTGWWTPLSSTAIVVEHDEALILDGHLTVAGASDLRVWLRGERTSRRLQPFDTDSGVRIGIPMTLPLGAYRLEIQPKDGRTPRQAITTLRVE